MIEEKGGMEAGTLLLAAAGLPAQANDRNTAELCVSCHSPGPWGQNEPSSLSSQVLGSGSLGRRTKYQCQVQGLRIFTESLDGKGKSGYKFCSKY